MVNLAIIELNTLKSSKKKNVSHNSLKPNPYIEGTTRFIPSIGSNSFKTEVNNVTENVKLGQYCLKNKYTLIYLYKVFEDKESEAFISNYGGKLHNQSSSNISILTYFEPDIVDKWTNVQFRETLDIPKSENYEYIMELVTVLKEKYKVEYLPSIIVVKKEHGGKEKSFNISLSGYKADHIYSTFTEIIDIINDNCEEDFIVIAKEIFGSDFKLLESKNIQEMNTVNYISALMKKYEDNHNHKYKLEDLADSLGISERQFRNKRNNNKLTREECLLLAIILCVPVKRLNDLLRLNNHVSLGMGGRDGIIRQCLNNGLSIYETNDLLMAKSYPTINPGKNVFD